MNIIKDRFGSTIGLNSRVIYAAKHRYSSKSELRVAVVKEIVLNDQGTFLKVVSEDALNAPMSNDYYERRNQARARRPRSIDSSVLVVVNSPATAGA